MVCAYGLLNWLVVFDGRVNAVHVSYVRVMCVHACLLMCMFLTVLFPLSDMPKF